MNCTSKILVVQLKAQGENSRRVSDSLIDFAVAHDLTIVTNNIRGEFLHFHLKTGILNAKA